MTLTLTPEEQATIAQIRLAGGFSTDEDAVRGALWWYACFLDVECPPERFALLTGAPRPEPPSDQPDLFAEDVP